MAEESVHSEIREGIAIARLDDGKANVISPGSIAGLEAHLDRAEKEAGAVLIAGRAGMLSAGFDLAIMRSGPEDVYRLVSSGAQLFLRMLELRKPVVVAATGHAIAAGAILLLAADARIGAEGNFKIGLNEVGAGMTLPAFAIALARRRLSKRHFVRATTQAELYAPAAAVDAGFLDRVTSPDDLFDTAFAEARRLAALPQPSFGATKSKVHGAFAAKLRDTLAGDLKAMMGIRD